MIGMKVEPYHDQAGDPSAMGEAPALPPLRTFRVTVQMSLPVVARSAQDAHDMTQMQYARARIVQVEAE